MCDTIEKQGYIGERSDRAVQRCTIEAKDQPGISIFLEIVSMFGNRSGVLNSAIIRSILQDERRVL